MVKGEVYRLNKKILDIVAMLERKTDGEQWLGQKLTHWDFIDQSKLKEYQQGAEE